MAFKSTGTSVVYSTDSHWIEMSHLIDLDVAFYMHLIVQLDSAHVKCDV